VQEIYTKSAEYCGIYVEGNCERLFRCNGSCGGGGPCVAFAEVKASDKKSLPGFRAHRDQRDSGIGPGILGYLRERSINPDKVTEHLHRKQTFGRACHSISRLGKS
jgi:hypothetical protein